MNFVIAIPTYNRPLILMNKTIKLLRKHNIPVEKVLIFVKDKDQRSLIENLTLKNEYIKNIIETGAEGIKDTRNFLQEYFYNNEEYENVLYLDDDIKELHDYDKPVENLIELTNNIFDELKEENLYICGLSPYHNKFFLKHKTTKTLKYICGAYRAERIRRDKPIIYTPIGHFEDQLFSCEYFLRDGGVMRKNWIAIETKYFETQGGICGQMGGKKERMQEALVNKDFMIEKYPNMCRAVEKKYGWDVRLKHNFKLP